MNNDGNQRPEAPENIMSEDDEDPIVIPIDGVLDLHTFSPRDVPNLLQDYFDACIERGILDVRIIHGKGLGVLRDRVRSILSKHMLVENWSEAPIEAGGWGATLVRLRDRNIP